MMRYLIAGITLLIAQVTFAQKIVSRNLHSEAHKELLAKQANATDQISFVEKNTFIDLLEDDIEPELDIYTEGWNSKSVNPFKESEVPDTQVIDVTGYFMPVPGFITSNYGYRRRFRRVHKGVDLKIQSNDTIYAAFDGKVRLTSYERKGYGNYIIIRHPNGLETVYGHLNKHLVKEDQIVRAGEPIGLGGSTGRSTGPHLHFETRFMGYAINPCAIFDFDNQTTHTDTYTFNKKTYQKARNYAPAKAISTNEEKKLSYKEEPYTYIVKKGDTLSSIAHKNGVSAKTLRQLNNLSNTDIIRVGETLRLR